VVETAQRKSQDKSAWIPLREAIGDLERLPEGAKPNHYWSKAKLLSFPFGVLG
jgi:hypothetical protein